MTNLLEYKGISEYHNTLKNTSYDSGNDEYLTELENEVIEFDKVAENYSKKLHLSGNLCSNDVFMALPNNKEYVFVEFKNGYIGGLKEINQINRKIYDSMFILSDITKTNISELRNCISYILVYNESKNSYLNSGIESESYNYIAEETLRYAEEDYKRFGLEKFEKFLLKKTYCFSSKIFEEYLKKYNMS